MDPELKKLLDQLKTDIAAETRAAVMAEIDKRDAALAAKIKADKEAADQERAAAEAARIEAERRNAELRFDEQRAQRRGTFVDPEARDILRSVIDAMKEKRAITIPSGLGSVNFVKELVRIAVAKRPLLEKAKFFYGPNSSSNIGVWSPTLAAPANYAQGGTGVSADATAALSAITVTPYAYISLLAVGNEMLRMGMVDIEAELPSIFAEAFGAVMHAGMLTGDGQTRNMTGLFTASVITTNVLRTAAVGTPKIADMVGLALALQDYYDDGVIVMNPAIYAGLMADTTAGTEPYKQELIRTRTLQGVPLILTSGAPSAVTASAPVAVGGRMSEYAIGVAGEVTIEPMKKVGENLTYFQAVTYFNGKPILEKNFHILLVKAQ